MFGQPGDHAAIAFKSNGNPDVLIPFESFIVHSKVFSQQVWAGNVQREKDYEDQYVYDSLDQFGKACQNQQPNITPENVFGYYSLCGEWKVDDDVLNFASEFLDENGEKLLINHILFQIEHDQDTSIQKEQLKKNLPTYIDDSKLLELPFEVLKDCIDLKAYQKDNESFQKVFTFCLKYLDENQEIENCSDIFSTLDATNIQYEDFCRLTGRPHFDRSKLKDSLGMILTELLKRTVVMPDTMEKIQEKYQEDLKNMKEREEAVKAEEQESKLLREELEKEKEVVIKLTKQMDDLKESMFPFLKETKELHDSLMKEKDEMEKKQKELEEFKAAVPLYYPDYSNASSVGWSNRNASDDGWMCVQHGCSNYSSPSYVTVASKKNFIVAGCSSGYSYSSIFFPIRRGQNTNYYASSATSNASYFIRFKRDSIVGMPDWKNAIMKQWFQNYTAECDGWIYAECGSNGNQGYIQMNGGAITITISQQNNGLQSYSSVFIPISSGDTYIIYHGCYPGVCYFVPSKKDFQVGMPNYDQEQNQSWNTQYTAPEPGWIYAQCRSYNCTSQSTNNMPGILMVEGHPILISQNNGGGYYDNASVFIPIPKGGKYIAQGGYQAQSISFFPFLRA